MDWTKISAIIACVIFALLIGGTLRKNPQLLTKANLNKSLSTMGLLGLGLIGFIAVLVLLLKSTS